MARLAGYGVLPSEDTRYNQAPPLPSVSILACNERGETCKDPSCASIPFIPLRCFTLTNDHYTHICIRLGPITITIAMPKPQLQPVNPPPPPPPLETLFCEGVGGLGGRVKNVKKKTLPFFLGSKLQTFSGFPILSQKVFSDPDSTRLVRAEWDKRSCN